MAVKYLDSTGLLYVIGQLKDRLVAKESGKGLSTNDLTNDMVTSINSISSKANKATTLAGYGITDAKIDNGTITLGTSTIKPITDISSKANIASPTFTGTPKAPTATAGTNNTQIATTAFVTSAVSTALAGVVGMTFEKVEKLPTTGSNGVIYLVSNSGSAPNVYDEYFWDGTNFELFGTTAMDLSGYVLTSDLVAITTADIDAMFTSWPKVE